jgi:hypothetical protein
MRMRWVSLRPRFVGVAIVVLATIFGIWLGTRSREPLFRGKKVSDWVEIYCLQQNNAKLHMQAVCALVDLGTNAAPAVLKMAGRRDLPIKKLILKVPIPDSILNALRMKQAYARWATASTDWPYMASRAFVLLGRDNQGAVPGLIPLLSSDNPATRMAAIDMLRSAGTNAQAALPALASAKVHDTDLTVRDLAQQTIAAIEMGVAPGSFVPPERGSAPWTPRIRTTPMGIGMGSGPTVWSSPTLLTQGQTYQYYHDQLGTNGTAMPWPARGSVQRVIVTK